MNPVHRFARRAAGGLLPVLLWSISGCQTGEQLTLDATSRPAKERVASYSLAVGDPTIETDSLRHKEAAALVKAALAGNGYYESPDPVEADMVIKVDYGIDRGRSEMVQESSPVYRMEPGATSTITVGTGTMGPDGQEIYRTVTVREPDERVYVGERFSSVKRMIYEKRLVLEARRTRADGPGQAPEDVFIVEVLSTGEDHDLRKTLPVLAAVALEHMGEETNGRKAVTMTDTEAIAFVKDTATTLATESSPSRAPGGRLPR
jgi:hypothetical protein